MSYSPKNSFSYEEWEKNHPNHPIIPGITPNTNGKGTCDVYRQTETAHIVCSKYEEADDLIDTLKSTSSKKIHKVLCAFHKNT